MLTAHEIRTMVHSRGMQAQLVIDPWNPEQLNPNSYDLTLSPIIKIYDETQGVLDVRKEMVVREGEIPDHGLVLEPNELYLGCSNEYTESHGLVPMINGKSSLARLGISVHQTGGFGDIDFYGHWTLEITVVKPVRVYPNMRIAQLCWFLPVGFINMRYKGKYQNSKSAAPIQSRSFEDWKDE